MQTQQAFTQQETNPLASIEQWEDDVLLRYPESGGTQPTHKGKEAYRNYDSPERACYWEKVESVQNRRKMRVRVYGSLDGKLPPTVFVEIKHKCDGRGVKRRLLCTLDEAL